MITLKKWNGNAWAEESPKVTISTIVASGTPSSSTFLRGDGAWATPAKATLTSLGVTATSAELNYTDGVTSNIQTQLNGKQATITGGASTIASSNLTAYRALISNGSGKVAVSTATSSELSYLGGVTSNIQTQLNGKAASSHGHDWDEITGKPSSLGGPQLIRSRSSSSSLSSVSSGDATGTVNITGSLSQGDTIMIEVNSSSSYTNTPKVITITLGSIGTTPPTDSTSQNVSFSVWSGTSFYTYSFTVSCAGSTLFFGSKKYIRGVFSGTTISWTTGNYTLYVGKVWKL